ncbi:uncharacterized protein BKA78DRAFT_290661, partial [Phyllosticta capitalensis]|uniref:uncharacterized protein n=1 Tax=Phyllosticta capitalensis TaxID=121624 RepID=UPI0031326AA9
FKAGWAPAARPSLALRTEPPKHQFCFVAINILLQVIQRPTTRRTKKARNTHHSATSTYAPVHLLAIGQPTTSPRLIHIEPNQT